MADKVRFEALERLDLVDANALQSLVYNHVSEAFGALMGYAAGALCTIHWDVDYNGALATATTVNTHTATPQAFQYYYSHGDMLGDDDDRSVDAGDYEKAPKRLRGEVITYNPADEGQNTYGSIDWGSYRDVILAPFWLALANVDAAAYVAAGANDERIVFPFVWARPFEVATDSDSRRKWNVGAGVESPVTIQTRIRTLTQFQLSATQPVVDAADANQNAWVIVARLAEWHFQSDDELMAADGTTLIPNMPVFRTISVWDTFQDIKGTATESVVDKGLQGINRFIQAPGSDLHKFKSYQESFNQDVDPTGVVQDLPPGQFDAMDYDAVFNASSEKQRRRGTPNVSHFMQGKHDPASEELNSAAGWMSGPYTARTSLLADGYATGEPLDRLGLPALLTLMRERMLKHLHTNGEYSWHRKPTIGLMQAYDKIVALETELKTYYQKNIQLNPDPPTWTKFGDGTSDGVCVLAQARVRFSSTIDVATELTPSGNFNYAKVYVDNTASGKSSSFGLELVGSSYTKEYGTSHCLFKIVMPAGKFEDWYPTHVQITPKRYQQLSTTTILSNGQDAYCSNIPLTDAYIVDPEAANHAGHVVVNYRTLNMQGISRIFADQDENGSIDQITTFGANVRTGRTNDYYIGQPIDGPYTSPGDLWPPDHKGHEHPFDATQLLNTNRQDSHLGSNPPHTVFPTEGAGGWDYEKPNSPHDNNGADFYITVYGRVSLGDNEGP